MKSLKIFDEKLSFLTFSLPYQTFRNSLFCIFALLYPIFEQDNLPGKISTTSHQIYFDYTLETSLASLHEIGAKQFGIELLIHDLFHKSVYLMDN